MRRPRRNLLGHIKALEHRGPWTCRGCGTAILGPKDVDDLCSEACRVGLARPSRAQILACANVPPAYHTFHPRPWPTDPSSGLRLDGWRGDPVSVLIAGGVGTGKSTMAAEVLVRQVLACSVGGIPRETDALWIRPMQLLDELRQSSWQRARPLWMRALSCKVLVVDDLGAGGRIGELIVELVEARCGKLLLTIITTWCPFSRRGGPGSIEELSSPIYDRLEGGACFLLEGESRRRSR